jgi:hypothetical protein
MTPSTSVSTPKNLVCTSLPEQASDVSRAAWSTGEDGSPLSPAP